jgi:hypothetical protein
MALATNALTTLEAVKSYLKIDLLQTVDDARLEDLINACSGAIDRKISENHSWEDRQRKVYYWIDIF